ncbi:hypothetical protein VNO77_43501 [Canavalia gladiata]|uniref:Uncharacterized protein n=1 Tax=Canavalia gladiata TaxID=3824 RepID=A0AAN9JU73_CANGL
MLCILHRPLVLKTFCETVSELRTWFLELSHSRGITILCPVHCSMCVAQGGHDDLMSSSPSSGLSPAIYSGFQTQPLQLNMRVALVAGLNPTPSGMN